MNEQRLTPPSNDNLGYIAITLIDAPAQQTGSMSVIARSQQLPWSRLTNLLQLGFNLGRAARLVDSNQPLMIRGNDPRLFGQETRSVERP